MNIIPTRHQHSKRNGLLPDPFQGLAGLRKLKWFFTWIDGRNFSKIYGTKKGSVLKTQHHLGTIANQPSSVRKLIAVHYN